MLIENQADLFDGTESTEEYQASKPHHNGLQPRLELPKTPLEYMATFSVRFIGGTPDGVVEIDDISVWSIHDEVKKDWAESLVKIAAFEHVNLKK